MNVLLTSAGRRNYLVGYFRAALRGRGRVYAADAKASAPALGAADNPVLVPAISAGRYIDVLVALCARERIGLLVPLHDAELPLLAGCRARFAEVGTTVVVSSAEVIEQGFDKWATYQFLRRSGYPAPRTYLSLSAARQALERGDLRFPLVLKPRWGSASVGLEVVHDEAELELNYALAQLRLAKLVPVGMRERPDAVLVQAFLPGEEYGLDIVNDLSGRYVTTFAKRKLGMRAGETDRAVTVADRRLSALGGALGRALGHVGNLDCDVFMVGGEAVVLELNPRFGGGYPFSHTAGADLPAALIAWAEGRTPDPAWLRAEPGVTSEKRGRLARIDTRWAARRTRAAVGRAC